MSGCPACTQLAADVQSVTAFIERVAEARAAGRADDPHSALCANGRRASAEERVSVSPSWIKRLFGGFVQSVLQPRYVMGMAMTILSFSMLARFAHIEPRQLRPADLDPVKGLASHR